MHFSLGPALLCGLDQRCGFRESITIEPMSEDVGERRQLAVMFDDLVDSTALSTRLDPEDLREIIGPITDVARR